MINIWGPEPRSKYHTTIVRKVYRYLITKQECDKAGYEKQLVPGLRTDAVGYNTKRKTWYLCEIKVDESDLLKAPLQIYQTVSRFSSPKNPRYHKGDAVVPVIAFPTRVQKILVQHNNWDSLCNLCKTTGVAIWVIKQSTVKEVMGPKIKKSVKTKSARASTTKTKTLRAKKTKAKGTKRRITKTTRAKSKRAKAKKR